MPRAAANRPCGHRADEQSRANACRNAGFFGIKCRTCVCGYSYTVEIPALGGGNRIGDNVDIGYFDQQMAQYHSKKTVLDEFWDEYPNLDQTEVRSSLGAFLFTQEEVFKTVDMLSGGEKVRLELCKILRKRPNFLILDEPTNHLDIDSVLWLEDFLLSFSVHPVQMYSGFGAAELRPSYCQSHRGTSYGGYRNQHGR